MSTPESWQEGVIGFFVLVLLFLFYFGPLIWVLASSRSRGATKFGWFLVTLFFSWLGLAVFLIATHTPQERR